MSMSLLKYIKMVICGYLHNPFFSGKASWYPHCKQVTEGGHAATDLGPAWAFSMEDQHRNRIRGKQP